MARLTGCRNFLPARRCADGVLLDGWGFTLPLRAEGERVTVAVPDGAITLTEGAHRAQIRRVIRDLNATVVLLCPIGDTDAPPLRAALPDGMEASEGQMIAFSLRAEKCMCYA